MSCGSGSGALAADVAARDRGTQAGDGRRDFQQSQFRRTAECRGARHVPRVAAAGGGLCGRRLDPARPDARPLGRRSRTARRCSSPTYGLATPKSAPRSTRALTGDLFHRAYDAFADPGPEWADIPHPTGPVFAWDPDSMYLRRPPFLDAGRCERSRAISARAHSADARRRSSRPITSRPAARSPPTRHAGAYLPSTACRRRNSAPTSGGARTTR